MSEFFDFFSIILLVVIVIAVNKAKMNARKSGKDGGSHSAVRSTLSKDFGGNASRKLEAEYEDFRGSANRARLSQNRSSYAQTLKTKDSATARSNYGRSAYEFDSSLRAAASSAGHSNFGKAGGLRATTTLHDDRENDWMAKQLRYERRVRSSTDLGAAHEDNCDALSLKLEHLPLHGRQ